MGAAIRPVTADRGSKLTMSVRHRQSNGTPFDHSESDVSLVVLERSDVDTVISTHVGSGTEDGWLTVEVDGADADWPAGHQSYRLVVDGEFMVIGPFFSRTAGDV